MEVHHILQKYQTPEGKSLQNKTHTTFLLKIVFLPLEKNTEIKVKVNFILDTGH